MSNYRPSEPFNVPMFLLTPTYKTAKGSTKKVYSETGELFYCSFRSFGGTEKIVNDTITIEDTAVIETWFNPDIKSDCIVENSDGLRYEILGTPENINMRNQILRFKVRSIKGGA
jgi:hypothetical protein